MKKHKILIVEPDDDYRVMLDIYFNYNGYDVATFDNADNIISALEVIPEIIIIDSIVAHQINLERILVSMQIPTIYLFDKDKRSDRTGVLEFGVDDYVARPFDIEEIRIRVENAISRSNH